MCKNDLGKIFNEYSERKKWEKEQANTRKKKEQIRIKLVTKKLKENVIPVLETISKEIKNKGHKARIIKNLENSLDPQIVFKFSPVFEGKEDNPIFIDSSISFGATIKKEILLIGANPIKEISSVEIENLTKNMIKGKVLEYIKEVLQAI